MSNSRTTERGTAKSTRSLLVALMVALVALFAVGCGSSNEDYVFTGNNNPTPNTGSVTFEFAKPVNVQAVVPAATTDLSFEFFNAQNATVLGPIERAFGNTITIPGVPSTATHARVTALDVKGNPLATMDATFNVVVGGNVLATIAAAVPVTFTLNVTPDPANTTVGGTVQLLGAVNFSDGSSASIAATGGTIAFTSAAPAIATVGSANGLVTGVTVGNTQVVATLALNGVSTSDTVVVSVTTGNLVATPSPVNLTNTTTSQVVATSINGAPVAATGTLGNFTGGVLMSNLSFNNATRTVTSTGIVNGTAQLFLTFTPVGGIAQNTTVQVNVNRQ